jgi:DNA polymerase-3 subunit gamma/tau
MPIAREAAGSMRDGQSLLDQVLSFADGPITADRAAEILGLVDRKLLHELLRAVVDGESDVVLRTYAEITQFGVDSRSLANELLTLLRHATVATLLEDTARLIDLPIEETEALGALAREAGVEAVQRRFDILSSATDEIARSDTPDLVLEMALIRMSRVRPFVPVDTLVERLLELERRLMSGRVGARSAPASRSAPAPRPAPEPRPARTATRPPPIAKEPAPPKVVEPPPPKAEVAPSPKVEEPPPPKAEVPPPPKAEVPPPPKAEVPPPPKAEVPPPIEEPSPPVEEPPAPVEPGAARDATGWAAFVESVSGSTAAILGEGRFRRADGEELILGFPKPSVHQMAVKKLASPRGQKALTAFFGPGVRVVCEEVSEDDAGPLSPGEQARADTAARRKAREERARAHPAVDKIQAQGPGAKVGRIRHLED